MNSRRLHPWIGVPAVLLCALGTLFSQTGQPPVLLPLGIVGLGTLTLASERWRAPRETTGRSVPRAGEHTRPAR